MNIHFEVTFAGDYVKVRSEGEKNFDVATKVWTAVSKTCEAHQCFKVLGISRSTIPISTIEGFSLYELFRDLGITAKYRIAWVEFDPEATKNLHFAETVLQNRISSRIRVFSNLEEAQNWLLAYKEEH